MSEPLRKKSPRAPSLPLGEAIDRVAKVYKAEGRHQAPLDIVAKHMGYKDATSGSALQTLASLRYYGLVERPGDGLMGVSKDFETFTFSQDEKQKQRILVGWLKTPPVFAELLDKYGERLPSDGNIKFDLIQKGFLAAAADSCVGVFRRSVDDAHYFETINFVSESENDDRESEQGGEADYISDAIKPGNVEIGLPQVSGNVVASNVDRIPVRLAGGRRAILEIPIPFFEVDKQRLKAHIDLLLTDDESD